MMATMIHTRGGQRVNPNSPREQRIRANARKRIEAAKAIAAQRLLRRG